MPSTLIKTLFVLFLTLPLTGQIASAATLERVDVVESGTFRIETGVATAKANTPTGEVTAVDRAVLIEATDTVEARKGTEFGFRYTIVGEPEGDEVELDIVITYPEAGLSDPATGKSVHESRYSTTKKIGTTEYLGYGIEAEWEAVPGPWSFEIWHEGAQLARLVFTVTQ